MNASVVAWILGVTAIVELGIIVILYRAGDHAARRFFGAHKMNQALIRAIAENSIEAFILGKEDIPSCFDVESDTCRECVVEKAEKRRAKENDNTEKTDSRS